MKAIWTLLFFVSLYGCYEDKGNYDYKDVNKIRIEKITTNEKDYTSGYELGSLVKMFPTLHYSLDSTNLRLGFKWILAGREIGHERELNWIADTVGTFFGTNFYLQIRDSVTGIDYLSGLLTDDESAGLQIKITGSNLAGGWLVVTQRDGVDVIDYVAIAWSYDPVADEYNPFEKVIYDVFGDRNGGEKLGGDITAIECTWALRARSSQILILQNGGQGPLYVSGETFNRSGVKLADEFVGGLPNVKFVNAYDKVQGTLLLTDDGQVYMRKKELTNAYFTGKYPDYTVLVEKGMDISRMTSYRYDDVAELTFDKKNKRFLLYEDRSGGGAFSTIFQKDNTEYTMLNDMGDVEILFSGTFQEGRDYFYLLLFKNNNPGKDGKCYIQKVLRYSGKNGYEMRPAVEKKFLDQDLLNGKNVFAICPKMKQYLLFSAGEKQDKLYEYMFAGDEAGVANARLLYDFKGRSIKSIVLNGVSSAYVYGGVALSNGEVCEISVAASAFINGLSEVDEEIIFYEKNFGAIKFMRYWETRSNIW